MSYHKGQHLDLKERRIRGWSQLPNTQRIAAGLTPDDLAGLEKAIYGEVVLPDDSTYDEARRQANPAFNRFPGLVVYCETHGDVRHSLDFAQRHKLQVTCRSGGHSTAGYSVSNGGMVLDTSRIRYVHLSVHESAIFGANASRDRSATSYAHVGAGSQWGYVGAALDSYGLHVPGGGCESVCVAGFMQGGGYGYTSRMFGMNCDNVVEVKVMLADGRIVLANERQNYPLFWAIRGGTGNNFGVLLEVTYRLQRPGQFWGFSIRWDIQNAAQAIVAIQNGYMKTNPSRLIGFETHGTTLDGRQVLLARGMFRGSEAEALEALRPLLSTQGAELEYGFPGSYYDLNRHHEQGIIASVPPGAKEDKQSGYLRSPMSLAEWERVIDMFGRSPNPYSVFNLEAYGGAINEVRSGSNAFIHRDAYCNFFLDVFWLEDSDREHAVRYLDDFMTLMQPYFDRPDGRPEANQDYPRRTQTNYMDLYFSGFVQDLVAAKRLYDPANVFHYEQSIPLEYPVNTYVAPTSPGFTGREGVVVEYP
jgi:FAD/FMN-containing dehydrogenase